MKSLSTTVVFLSLIFALFPANAQSQVDASFIQYLKTAAEYKVIASQATASGGVPRLSDKTAATLLTELGNSGKYLEGKTFDVQQLGLLNNVCGEANSISVGYLFFDAKKSLDPQADATVNAQKLQTLMSANSITFQQELAIVQPFITHCMAAQIPVLTTFVKNLEPQGFTEVRRNGLRQLTRGLATSMIGILTSASEPQMGDYYREKSMRALATNARVFSAALPLALRKEVLDFLNTQRTLMPQKYAAYVDKVEQALLPIDCDNLCLL